MVYTDICQPNEQHGDQNRPATDFIWSKIRYRLDQIAEDKGSHALYYLPDGPDTTFVREELIPEDVF